MGKISAGLTGTELVDERELRRALDDSLTPEEFRVRLQAMALRSRAGEETPLDVDPEKPKE